MPSCNGVAREQIGIEWAVRDGRMSVRSPRGPHLSFRGMSGSVTVDGRALSLVDAGVTAGVREGETGNLRQTVTFTWENGLTWAWDFGEVDGGLEMVATLRNDSGGDVRIGEWNILHGTHGSESLFELGEDPDQVRFLLWRPWEMRVERFAGQDGPRASSTLCHLYDPASGLTVLLGFVTLDRMSTHHRVRYTAGRGVSEYRATCSCGEFNLPAGKELKSETLRIGYHDDPYRALDDWADGVHERYRPSFEGTQGVCLCATGAWLDTFTSREETWPEVLREYARAVTEKLKGFGVRSLSGGTHNFLKYGLPGNWLLFDEIDAPGGYAKLLKDLHAEGFDFKFWFSPFWFFGEAEGILEENRENLIRDAGGEAVSQSFGSRGWEFAHGPFLGKELTKYFLDGTHPKTKAYLRKVFAAYRELGARSYMLDFLSIVPGARIHDDTLLPLEAGRRILEVIREAAGRDTHLQTAVASSPGFIGCINAARVVRDYGEGRPMHPLPNWRNATYCMHDDHFSNAHAFVQNAAAAWFTHRKIYVNDLNGIAVDKPVPLEHARISITMFGLSGESPMILADDLRVIDPERLRMLKMCLPRTPGIPIPVDLFDHVFPDDYCHVLKKHVTTPWDSYTIVAVFNTEPDAGPYTTRIDFDRLGLAADGICRVFEFWNGEYMGAYRGSFPCTIPAGACRLYRLSTARPHPWLIGTDMHVEQGRAEIESLTWDERRMTLRGTAVRPAGERGSLYFLMPRHLRLTNFARTHTMKEVIDMQTVLWLPLDDTSDRREFELRFEVMDTPFVSRIGWLPYATAEEWLRYVEEHRDPDSTRVIE